MGIIVPAGRHQIFFEFEPISFKWGTWITSVAVTILVGFGIVVLSRWPRSVYEKLVHLVAPVFDPEEQREAGQMGIPGQSH
jgi:hypothetical protein